MQERLREIIAFIGDDPSRSGLVDSPGRIVRSWNELFSGYGVKPENVLTDFDAEGYSGLVVLRGCEFVSTCEHHFLPFYGVAHVAYLPRKKIVGISKLARLVEIFSRRLQNQERLGQQVAEALMRSDLRPRAAACILDAKHLCMIARGVKKQGSTMVTASLRGVFDTNAKVRAELYALLNMPGV